MYTTNCPICGGLMGSRGTTETLVAYLSPAGHDHDDNCRERVYICHECGGEKIISKQNKCKVCDWVGKTECFCHKGKKVEDWPNPLLENIIKKGK